MRNTARKLVRTAALGVVLTVGWAAVPAAAELGLAEGQTRSPVGPRAERQAAHFTDGADDAYRVPAYPVSPPAVQPADPDQSNPKADILMATLSDGTGPGGGSATRTYTLTLTVSGRATRSYDYMINARFGRNCQLYHSMVPGKSALAYAYCGNPAIGTQRFVGSFSGSEVSAESGAVSASFTYRTDDLPRRLRRDRDLGPLWAWTCPADVARGCSPHAVLDTARSPIDMTFHL